MSALLLVSSLAGMVYIGFYNITLLELISFLVFVFVITSLLGWKLRRKGLYLFIWVVGILYGCLFLPKPYSTPDNAGLAVLLSIPMLLVGLLGIVFGGWLRERKETKPLLVDRF
jgi:hypothetical protein